MRESKTESISRIGKLIEIFHDLSSTERQGHAPEDDSVAKLQGLAARFEFEVRAELARIGAYADISDHEGVSNLAESVERICHGYQEALRGVLTAHTRAMLNRQFEEVRKLRGDFIAVGRAE